MTSKRVDSRLVQAEAWLAAHPNATADDVQELAQLILSGSLGRVGELEEIAARLVALDAERSAVLERRDALVADLRAQGVSWSRLAEICGVSREALQKRRAGMRPEAQEGLERVNREVSERLGRRAGR